MFGVTEFTLLKRSGSKHKVRYDEYVQFLELASERHVKVAGMQAGLPKQVVASHDHFLLGASLVLHR